MALTADRPFSTTAPDLPSGVWELIVRHACTPTQHTRQTTTAVERQFATHVPGRTINALCRSSREAMAHVFRDQATNSSWAPPLLGVDLDALVEFALAAPRAERTAALARFGARFAAAPALRLTTCGFNGGAGAAYFDEGIANYMKAVHTLQIVAAARDQSDLLWRLPSPMPFVAAVRHVHLSLHYSCLLRLGPSMRQHFPSLSSAHFIVVEWNNNCNGHLPYHLQCLDIELPPALASLTIEGSSDERWSDVSDRVFSFDMAFVSSRDDSGEQVVVDAVPSLERLSLRPYLRGRNAWFCNIAPAALPALRELVACLDIPMLRQVCAQCPALSRLTLQAMCMIEKHALASVIEKFKASLLHLVELEVVRTCKRAGWDEVVREVLQRALHLHLPNARLLVR